MLLLIPLIVAVLLIAIVLDEIMFFLKHNKKYLVDGTNWITEVFKWVKVKYRILGGISFLQDGYQQDRSIYLLIIMRLTIVKNVI